MKIVLLYPCWTESYGLFAYFARKNSSWPPMNLALLAAILESEGHDVSIIDGQVEQLSVDEIVNQALALKPDIVGFTATSPFFHIQRKTAEALKTKAPDMP